MARDALSPYDAAVTIINWDGGHIPEELQALPPGKYVLQPAEKLVALTPEEEAGIEQALQSIADGRGIAHDEVRKRILALQER